MADQPIEIVLPLNASADRLKCGSCYFFTRRGESEWGGKRGVCRLKLPPQYALQPYNSEAEQPSNTVEDTDDCDLWRASGKTFIVSQRIKP